MSGITESGARKVLDDINKTSSPTPVFFELLSQQPPDGYVRQLFGLGHQKELVDEGIVSSDKILLPGEIQTQNWPHRRAMPMIAGPTGTIAITAFQNKP